MDHDTQDRLAVALCETLARALNDADETPATFQDETGEDGVDTPYLLFGFEYVPDSLSFRVRDRFHDHGVSWQEGGWVSY